MAPQYIFTMHRVSKVHPPDKTVLNDVTLAFLPGAKIGVLGYNGSGKSTLLRIMAGRDTDIRGDAMLAPGASVGLLEQEPHLDEAKDVRGNVMEGVAETAALVERFNELAANYSEETADEFADLQARIDAADAWNLDTNVEYAMDALRLPPARRRRHDALRRRAPPRGAVPAAAQPARPAAPRRADEPPRRRVGGLARAAPGRVQGHRRGRHPRPLLPRQRRRLDPRARPWPRAALRGQLLELARAEAGPPGHGGEVREARASGRSRPSSTGSARTPRGARRSRRRAWRTSSALVAQERNVKLDEVQIHIPTATHLGGVVVEAEGLRKGFGDKLLIDGLEFSLPPGGIVGIIGANGAGKTTLFRMITGRAARRRHAARRRDGPAGLRRPEPRRPRGRQDRLGGDLRRHGADQGRRGVDELARRTSPASTSRAPTSRRRWPSSPAASATGCTWPSSCARGGNLLLLDEPTNDLDVDTLRALEEALLAYAGCAVVISHDRWFLDRVATHVLAFEGDSQVTWFEGNFEEYERHRHELLGAEADRPHRLTYKRLTRTA